MSDYLPFPFDLSLENIANYPIITWAGAGAAGAIIDSALNTGIAESIIGTGIIGSTFIGAGIGSIAYHHCSLENVSWFMKNLGTWLPGVGIGALLSTLPYLSMSAGTGELQMHITESAVKTIGVSIFIGARINLSFCRSDAVSKSMRMVGFTTVISSLIGACIGLVSNLSVKSGIGLGVLISESIFFIGSTFEKLGGPAIDKLQLLLTTVAMIISAISAILSTILGDKESGIAFVALTALGVTGFLVCLVIIFLIVNCLRLLVLGAKASDDFAKHIK